MKAIIIRTTSQIPIYQQLYEQISTQILNGVLESDTLLPSIRGMAKELRVSIITIKKTWEMLERNDYIYTVAGKGSYVKKRTKQSLEKKKLKTVEAILKDSVLQCKQMDITKDEIIKIVLEIYNQS